MHSSRPAAAIAFPSLPPTGDAGRSKRHDRRATPHRRPFGDAVARWTIALLLATVPFAVGAKEAVAEAADPALEARMVRVTSELRCLVCQNQTIADSHADLAVDLRAQVREQLHAGRSDAQIVDYMTARYGDFVLYRPPFKATTVLLWFGPGLMLAFGATALVVVLRRRGRMSADAFEADDDDPAHEATDAPAYDVDPRHRVEHA